MMPMVFGTIRWPDLENPDDCGDYVSPQIRSKLGGEISDADGVGTIRWPDFENPNDCGDYVPPQKRLGKAQSKITI